MNRVQTQKYHNLHPGVRVENHGLAAQEAKAQGVSPEGGMHPEEPDRGVCVHGTNPGFKALHFLFMWI